MSCGQVFADFAHEPKLTTNPDRSEFLLAWSLRREGAARGTAPSAEETDRGQVARLFLRGYQATHALAPGMPGLG